MEINGYKIISEIHRGPITTVYSARHFALDRKVLLKILNIQWHKENDLLDRFHREAKICARLEHVNIVNIYDFSTTSPSIFISMEYIEGQTLDEYFKNNSNRTFSHILNIFVQILSGLSYAHKQGAIHRDIKPSNIMIAGNGQVKITDFGMATISDLPNITENGNVVGSPAYMSPEQALGKELDQRSDLFSLGATLFTLYTGSSPFASDNLGATVQNILKKEPDFAQLNQENLPDWFINILRTLLAKSPEERPVSAESVLAIINESGEETVTPKQNHPDENRAQPEPFILKRKRTAVIWALPVFVLIALISFWPDKEPNGDTKLAQVSHELQMPKSDTSFSTTMNSNTDSVIVQKIKKNDVAVKARPELKMVIPDNKIADAKPSEPVQKRKLFIIAKPWAEVFIDSAYYETTPLTRPLQLAAGDYIIELRNPNYQPYTLKYSAQSAGSETLMVNLRLNVGFLNIRVLPWAEVHINGNYLVTTPLENPITIPAGEHIVSLVNPNYTTITDTIRILAGQTINKRFNLLK